MREKLIELIMKSGAICYSHTEKELADYLIANGVTIATDNNVGHKWIPASEPPKKNGKYLCRYVFSENYAYPFEQVLYYFATDKKPHFQHEGELGLKVTHWMPLPEPPKGE